MPKFLLPRKVRYLGRRKDPFHLAGQHELHVEARDQAEWLRNGGFNARIIRTTTGYQVWVSRWVQHARSFQ